MTTPRTSHLLTQIGYVSLLVLTALAPLLVIPFTDTFAVETKQLLFIVSALLVVAIWAIRTVVHKTVLITPSPFTAGLIAWFLVVVVTAVLAQRYSLTAFAKNTGVLLSLSLIAGFGSALSDLSSTQARKAFQKRWVLALLGSSAFLSLMTWLEFMGVGPSWLFNSVFGTQLPHTIAFNLAESPLVATQVFIVALAAVVGYLLSQPSEDRARPWFLALGGISLAGLGLTAWSILPGNPGHQLTSDFGAVWSIVLDIFKNPRTALLGVGPDSFLTAYTRFRPLWLNGTPSWSVEFTQGSNLPLTLLVTTGLAGFSIYAFLVFQIAKQLVLKPELRRLPASWALVGLLITQLLFPPHVVLISLFAATLAVWLGAQHQEFEQIKLYTLILRLSHKKGAVSHSTASSPLVNQGIGILLALAVIASLYGVGRAYAAQHYLYRSTQAATANQLVETYELQKKAKNLNPFSDVARRRFAQTSLLLASALSNKADITDDEREQALLLVQQAVGQVRTAVILEPRDLRNWQTMGEVYRQLIGVADGAEQWTIDSYVGAVRVAPTNPLLRLDLGAIFYAQANYAHAIKLFEQAGDLKPDLPNVHYSLANAHKMSGNVDQAELAYQRLLTILDPSTEAYLQTSQELQELQTSKKQAENAAPASTIQKTTTTPTQTGDTFNPETLNTPPETSGGIEQLLQRTDLGTQKVE